MLCNCNDNLRNRAFQVPKLSHCVIPHHVHFDSGCNDYWWWVITTTHHFCDYYSLDFLIIVVSLLVMLVYTVVFLNSIVVCKLFMNRVIFITSNIRLILYLWDSYWFRSFSSKLHFYSISKLRFTLMIYLLHCWYLTFLFLG